MASIADSKSLLLWALVVLVLSTNLVIVVGVRNSSLSEQDDEQKEFDRQHQILNKPHVRTIRTKWGDIFDCVDIYKQPAFDHLLLMNHTIQMKPTHLPERVDNKSSWTPQKSTISIFRSPLKKGCPEGTVPIRRTQKSDPIRTRSLSPLYKDDLKTAGVAYQSEGQTFFGVSADISIYNPKLTSDDQFSVAEIVILTGSAENYAGLHVGWAVNPALYGNGFTRCFAYWTADGGRTTGCYNTLCPGFVQVDRSLTPDATIPKVSVRGGKKYVFKAYIYQDKETKNWWLILGTVAVGYWPNLIVPTMNNGGRYIFWGGKGLVSHSGVSPPLGSGHFPTMTFDSCFFANMKLFDGQHVQKDPERPNMKRTVDCTPLFYGVYYFGYESDKGHNMEFGGPGGVCPTI